MKSETSVITNKHTPVAIRDVKIPQMLEGGYRFEACVSHPGAFCCVEPAETL